MSRTFGLIVWVGLCVMITVGCSSPPEDPCKSKTCGDKQRCVDGECVLSCATSETKCSDSCVDTSTDVKHCGACGKACEAGQECKAGKCETTCEEKQTACGASCVDISSDVKHCGACDNACQTGYSCQKGECSPCPVGLSQCEGFCVDFQTTTDNCGSCGNKCKPGDSCKEGKCIDPSACAPSETKCGASCVNVQTSTNHCGGCGKPCNGTCKAGKCEPKACSPTETKCGDDCINTQTSSKHCGGCNKACDSGKICMQGTCKEPPSGSSLAVLAGGSGSDYGLRMVVDDAGNVTLVGHIGRESATFGSLTLPVSQGDYSKAFVARLNYDGTWAWVAGPTGSRSYAYGVAHDAKGNVYITGLAEGGAKFGTIEIPSTDSGLFVAKLNAKGEWQWVASSQGGTSGTGNALVVDANENIYITGIIEKTTVFNTGSNSVTITPQGNFDIIIAKLNAKGEWQWVKSAGGPGQDAIRNIRLHPSGDLIVCGGVESGASFGSISFTGKGDTDVFVGRLDKTGEWKWVVGGGGPDADRAHGCALDSSGNTVVTGLIIDNATFGSVTPTVSGTGAVLVAKVDSNGKWLWARKAGGNKKDHGYGIALDKQDNIYIQGRYHGSAVFGASTITASVQRSNTFLAKLDASGQWSWARDGGGGSNSDVGRGLAFTKAGELYATGSFFTSPSPLYGKSVSGYGRGDIYVVRFAAKDL